MHLFRGGSGTKLLGSRSTSEATTAARPNRGPLLYAYDTRPTPWGARSELGVGSGAAARLLVFVSRYPIVTEHAPCRPIGIYGDKLRVCAQGDSERGYVEVTRLTHGIHPK